MIEHLIGVSNVVVAIAAFGSGDYARAALAAVMALVIAACADPLI